MKVSTKPISSPGRTEKFPPPLMRFLRSNVGSKSSRGSNRSRASPMFIRGKKNTVIEATQEPSSPKVTCIGQVRVRRSKKKKKKKKSSRSAPGNRRCRWLRWKLRPRSFRGVWRKWVSFFRGGYCKRPENVRDSPENSECNHRRSRYVGEYQEKAEDLPLAAENEVSVSNSPPKNAFSLTRCRSALYRSSSLASRFLESTLEKTAKERENGETGEKEGEEEKVPKSSIKEEDEEGINGINGKQSGGDESSINGVEEFGAIKAGPLILTRCKSEPARTGDKLFMSLSS